ncbi:MAG: hypothetical protein RL088_1841 [Verrucomicrobiota bacterium]|jgi:hypothetical protein
MFRRILKRVLLPPMVVIAALIMFVEEWIWDHLAAVMAWIAKARIIRALESWLSKLPPYGAAAAFLLPGTLLMPFKLAALYLIAHHHAIAGLSVIISAKIVGTACAARLYAICHPALLQLGWFRWTRDAIVRLKTRLYDAIKAMPGWALAVRWKNAIKKWLPRGGHFSRMWRAIGQILRKRFSRKQP